MLQTLLDTITNIPDSVWQAIGVALGISVLLQGLKNWLSLQSDKVITFLLTALAFISASIDYLSQAALVNPSVLGQDTVALVGLSTLLYRYAVKPLTNLIGDAKQYRARKERVAVTTEELIPIESVQPLVAVPDADVPVAIEPVIEPANF